MRLAGDLRVLKKSVHTGDVLPERGLCVRWTGFPPGVGGRGEGISAGHVCIHGLRIDVSHFT